ncbi:MAG: hypothetical protein GX895_03395 [Clostridiales bacterium]|uniref:hypothetical protein n=1 Tax=Clostridium sp. N3C TaxID=1776758 RepID=UPI00092E1E8F|nr:hypothetical protein [Clostridium sp. N3C]NLZ47826.1 hypothetical protein [Clostridiales bacterium]SCN22353.1 hypothetical protein N3C_0718 [Clostridium sp. N3C]
MNERQKEEQANRVDQLINLVEKHTRTERHLEQHSDISDPGNLENAEEVQRKREEEIDNLKNIIAYGDNDTNEVENLKRNIEYTEGYLEHNKDHMDSETLENTIEKQRHRKEQLDNLT